MSIGVAHNVSACAVAGIGGLGNVAKRNAKTDQLRLVPRDNLNKETESYEDTEPRHCTNLLLAVVAFHALDNFKILNAPLVTITKTIVPIIKSGLLELKK